jgi:flagellar motility protein MotE (MotC chaperone)
MAKKGGGCFLSLFLLCVLIALLIGGALFLDNVGVISLEKTLYPKLQKAPVIGKRFAPPEVGFEDVQREELRKLKESLEVKLAEIKELEVKVKQREEELKRKEKQLAALEDDLKQKKEAIRSREEARASREAKIKDLAVYYSNMKPEDAARIMEQMDDLLVVDVLRQMDKTIVAAIFMKMDPKKASEISRKMSR